MTPRPDYDEASYQGYGRLQGRVALITGGDSGIGRAVALAFVREGAVVREDGRGARGLRTAISRAASSKSPTVETVEGDGFVAARKVDEPRKRRGAQASSQEGQRRRDRPPKRRDQDASEIESLRDLAAGES